MLPSEANKGAERDGKKKTTHPGPSDFRDMM